MEDTNRLDDVDRWLAENDPPPRPPSAWGDDPLPDERPYRGSPRWYDTVPAPGEEILREHPDAARRKTVRAFNERWGWVYDFLSALWYWLESWWTTDMMLGVFRAGYGLIMVALLYGIIYSVFYASKHAPVRTLPTIDELMQPPQPEAPSPTDG